jgi:2C-methyl-D-erythritol 2,4-cyclodiphosphate synthase
MSPLFYIGRALGIASAERRASALARTDGDAADNAMADAFVAAERKPTIERAHDTTASLIDNMSRRKERLEQDIVMLEEELRQVGIVLMGAGRMLETIEQGLDPVAIAAPPAPPPVD